MRELNYKQVNDLISKYIAKDKDTFIYKIDGCLVDNYIITSNNLKSAIIKEKYLNEWSSINILTLYNKLPKKYEKVIELLDNEEEEKARELFFK